MKLSSLIITRIAVLLCSPAQAGERLGRYSANPYGADSTANPYSRAGSPYRSESPSNTYGEGLEIIGD